MINDAIVTITKRPVTKQLQKGDIDHSEFINNSLLFEEILSKLVNLYGIQINSINSENMGKLADLPGISTSKAFVYNN